MLQPEVFKPVLGYVKTELVINSIVVFFVLLVVGFRVAGRTLIGPGLWWDDWLIIFATVRPSIAANICREKTLTSRQPLGVSMLACQGLCKYLDLVGRSR